MTRTPRHAEIAGAGIAGLTMAAALGQRGWSVRVHERNDELREIGAGIAIWQNGLRALERIGVAEEIVGGADRIDHWQLRDERNRTLQDEWMLPGVLESYAVLRTDLHQALARRAREAGAEIATGSRVAAAEPGGVLVLEDGSRLHADLVVGADGVGSRVRDALGLAARVTDLGDGCGRHLIPRKPSDPRNRIVERWHGARRIGIVPCTEDQVYVYLCCPASDAAGCAQEASRETWAGTFPEFRDFIERIPDGGRWASFSDAVATRWSSGRVALIGDAAHAMSPNLGQAACLAMVNAVALAGMLDAIGDVPATLPAWERAQRPVTDQTQRFSRFYGWIGTHWPRPLLDLRSALVWGLAHSERMQARINVAARQVPQDGAPVAAR